MTNIIKVKAATMLLLFAWGISAFADETLKPVARAFPIPAVKKSAAPTTNVGTQAASTTSIVQATKKITPPISNSTPAETDNITSTIETSIETNDALVGLNIDVTDKDGVINLTGNAESNAKAAMLIEIAESAAGVKDVNISRLLGNNANTVPSDVVLSAKIKGTFIRENLFAEDTIGLPIKVKAFSGVVFLSGSVENQAIVDKAMTLAKTVPGVKTVKSEVIITDEHITQYQN